MNPQKFPQRKSPRLKGHDYSQSGAYFVTICSHQGQLLFGTIDNQKMKLDPLGELADWHLLDLPKHYPHIELDCHIVMPNHVHALIFIHDDANWKMDAIGQNGVGTTSMSSAGNTSKKRPTLGTMVGTYKAAVTRSANRRLQYETRIWQERYHDNIVRNEKILNIIRQYVISNPAKWAEDKFYL